MCDATVVGTGRPIRPRLPIPPMGTSAGARSGWRSATDVPFLDPERRDRMTTPRPPTPRPNGTSAATYTGLYDSSVGFLR
jgi:hypothetical protein